MWCNTCTVCRQQTSMYVLYTSVPGPSLNKWQKESNLLDRKETRSLGPKASQGQRRSAEKPGSVESSLLYYSEDHSSSLIYLDKVIHTAVLYILIFFIVILLLKIQWWGGWKVIFLQESVYEVNQPARKITKIESANRVIKIVEKMDPCLWSGTSQCWLRNAGWIIYLTFFCYFQINYSLYNFPAVDSTFPK